MTTDSDIHYEDAVSNVMSRFFSHCKMNEYGLMMICDIMQEIHASLMENFGKEYATADSTSQNVVIKCIQRAAMKTFPAISGLHAIEYANKQLSLHRSGILEYDPNESRNVIEPMSDQFFNPDLTENACRGGNRTVSEQSRGLQVSGTERPRMFVKPLLATEQGLAERMSEDSEESLETSTISPTIFRDGVKKIIKEVTNTTEAIRINEGSRRVTELLYDAAVFIIDNVADRSGTNRLEVEYNDVRDVVRAIFPPDFSEVAVLYGMSSVRDYYSGDLTYRKRQALVRKPQVALTPEKRKVETPENTPIKRIKRSPERSEALPEQNSNSNEIDELNTQEMKWQWEDEVIIQNSLRDLSASVESHQVAVTPEKRKICIPQNYPIIRFKTSPERSESLPEQLSKSNQTEELKPQEIKLQGEDELMVQNSLIDLLVSVESDQVASTPEKRKIETPQNGVIKRLKTSPEISEVLPEQPANSNQKEELNPQEIKMQIEVEVIMQNLFRDHSVCIESEGKESINNFLTDIFHLLVADFAEQSSPITAGDIRERVKEVFPPELGEHVIAAADAHLMIHAALERNYATASRQNPQLTAATDDTGASRFELKTVRFISENSSEESDSSSETDNS